VRGKSEKIAKEEHYEKKKSKKKKRFSWISAAARVLNAIVKADVVYTHGHHLLPVVVALLHELSKALHHLYSHLR